jgi:antitoxin (DNA-binding transcriptional repressor) of toxin-antitoxin stability system
MSAVLDPISLDGPSTAFAEAVARAEAGHDRIILTCDGKPVVALVLLSDLEAIEDAEDMRAAARCIGGMNGAARIGKPLPSRNRLPSGVSTGPTMPASDPGPEISPKCSKGTGRA